MTGKGKSVDSRLEKLTAAIHNQHLVMARYHGVNRVWQPYALGLGSDGQPLLRVFEVTKAGSPIPANELQQWKLMRVDRVESLKVTGTGFTAKPEYRQPDKAMTQIIATVEN